MPTADDRHRRRRFALSPAEIRPCRSNPDLQRHRRPAALLCRPPLRDSESAAGWRPALYSPPAAYHRRRVCRRGAIMKAAGWHGCTAGSSETTTALTSLCEEDPAAKWRPMGGDLPQPRRRLSGRGVHCAAAGRSVGARGERLWFFWRRGRPPLQGSRAVRCSESAPPAGSLPCNCIQESEFCYVLDN
jgi:hypothetical protein